MDDSPDEREEELSSITAIYPELVIKGNSALLDIPVQPSTPLLARFVPVSQETTPETQNLACIVGNGAAYIERDVRLSHLPPLSLEIILEDGYPSETAPQAKLLTALDWLPKSKCQELEEQVAKLWEEFGHCQILFSYIDFLQQAAEEGFDLDQSADGCLILPADLEPPLVHFDNTTKLATFNAGTFDCGICLEPKKGSSCYRLERCAHVFCRQCLQDFYNNAIKEGDVATVRCLDPSCGKEQKGDAKRKIDRPLHPRELLNMGVEESMVRRYVEMKRKKKLESDKNTIYCPRSWCQNPARSSKYPPIPKDLADYPDSDSEDEKANEAVAAKVDPSDRLAICENERCGLAFCRTCYKSWHGPYARCHPRDPNELSAEEKASYDYIMQNTSPCPYCNSPTQKSMGCNHMNCYQCRTHFCYLCGSWLEPSNPYVHYNKPGTECYQRLWELEEGDAGQAPEDGRGFVGARRWEQMAIEAAREADEAEAALLQADEDANAARNLAAADPPPGDAIPALENGMANVALQNVEQEQAQPLPRLRRPRNPFPAPPANRPAAAVRAHEQGHGRGNGGQRQVRQQGIARQGGRENPRRAMPEAEAQRLEEELRRFVEMAQRDEEDGWDSDELGEDDEYVIRER